MSADREDFIRWTGCLLDPASDPGQLRQAAHDWCAWALARLGIDENRAPTHPADPFFSSVDLGTGRAISPLAAARCVREFRRTTVFLRAMDAALKAARERFQGEKIHVMEAGCGPLAPLALAFAVRYPADEVQFTLLDLHPASLEGARRLAGAVGAQDSIRAFLGADATTVQFAPEDRPHAIACEILLRALTREPQVAATVNLAPQLRPGGIFLPERIDVDAVLFDSSAYVAASRADAPPGMPDGRLELGNVFVLEAGDLGALRPFGPGKFAARSVRVPPPGTSRLNLFTRIRVFGEHRLGDFESSLNLPEPVKLAPEFAVAGGEAGFCYEISANPGLRLV